MVSFPNCKINLGLYVINKRNDGYHNLETVFCPLAVKDILEIIPHTQNGFTATSPVPGKVMFSTSGLKVDGESTNNLCVKAYTLLQQDFPALPSIEMHLHKAIPMGAGLGGGSADAAFTLQLLNTQFTLGLSRLQLINYALTLGSDCPFFIINNPCFATGRGEIMEEVTLDLSGYSFVLINPGISIHTGWAFSQLNLNDRGSVEPVESLKNSIRHPISNWKNIIINDFEKPVFEKYHEIRSIKHTLYEQGALYASLTGSGSTVYGIFEEKAIPVFNFPVNYWVMALKA